MADTTESLVNLFYVLLRDRMTAGEIEDLLENHVLKNPDQSRKYSNRFLEAYARDIVQRLTDAGLKCCFQMCNTETDNVKLCSLDNEIRPLCAACRRRNPTAIVQGE